jgi:hypothetical protein
MGEDHVSIGLQTWEANVHLRFTQHGGGSFYDLILVRN